MLDIDLGLSRSLRQPRAPEEPAAQEEAAEAAEKPAAPEEPAAPSAPAKSSGYRRSACTRARRLLSTEAPRTQRVAAAGRGARLFGEGHAALRLAHGLRASVAGHEAALRPSAAREASPASKARTLEQPRAEAEAPPPGMSEVLGDPGRSLSAGRLEALGGGAKTARHSAPSCSSSSPLVRHATPRCSPLSARAEERAVSAPLLAAGAAGEAGVAGEAGGALSAAARTTLQLPAPLVAPGGRPDGGRPAWKCASHARSSSSEGGGWPVSGWGQG